MSPWFGPPENELGVGVPTGLLLARTDDLAIAVLDVTAYSTGFALRLALRIHHDAEGFDPRTFMMRLHGGPGAAAQPGGGLPDDLLRFGIEFADGRRATSLGPRPRPGDEPPAICMIHAGGGGGGGRGYELRYWVFPLPPPGPLTLAVEWPARGIELTKHEIDAAAIVAAAAGSGQLWEDSRPTGGGAAGGHSSFQVRLSPESPPPPSPDAA